MLPCILAATSTIIGAFLSFFLEEDLKPSVGAIHLPEEPQNIIRSPSLEDVERSGWSFTSSAWSRLRGRHSLQQPRWPLAFGPRTRQVSSGTAYGYHEPRRLRCVSTASRISSDAGPGMRSPELLTTEDLREYDHEENKRKSLVERFVLSNDDAVYLSLISGWQLLQIWKKTGIVKARVTPSRKRMNGIIMTARMILHILSIQHRP